MGEFQLKIKYHKNASKFIYDIKERQNIPEKNSAIKFLTVKVSHFLIQFGIASISIKIANSSFFLIYNWQNIECPSLNITNYAWMHDCRSLDKFRFSQREREREKKRGEREEKKREKERERDSQKFLAAV